MARDLKDFDAFWSETRTERQPVRVRGVVYELPTSIPAMLMLGMLAYVERGAAGGGVPMFREDLQPGGVIHDMVEAMFGAGALDMWLTGSDGLPPMAITELGDVLNFIGSQYAAPKEDADGDPLTSSPTGRTSSPGSASTTESTSPTARKRKPSRGDSS